MIELSYVIVFENTEKKTPPKLVSSSQSNKECEQNTSFGLLRNSILSLVHQTVPFWDLTIFAHADIVEELKKFVQSLTCNSKIYILPAPSKAFSKRAVASSSINSPAIIHLAISLVQGSWISVLPLGDILEPVATYILLKSALEKPRAALIYCDQDFYKANNLIGHPCYKPEFSIDLLYSQNYIGNFFIFNKIAVQEIDDLNHLMPDNWSYDLILRLLANYYKSRSGKKCQTLHKINHNQIFLHVGIILHRQHIDNSDDLFRGAVVKRNLTRIKIKSKQGLLALKNHFSSIGQNVLVSQVKPLVYRHDWSKNQFNLDDHLSNQPNHPLVTLIIPTRDGYSILKPCIDSIIDKTNYKNYEIIVIDNQSVCSKTIRYLNHIQSKHQNIRVLSYDKPFNYSDINNFASDHAKGSILGFINNDIEVLNSDWLTEMVSHAVRPDIGCVGALLFYPDGTIQHAGVVVGMNGVADHAFKAVDPHDPTADYFDILKSLHNPDAVTAATLLIRKDLFIKVGCFDHNDLVVAFNDVDLCLKVKKKGYRNLFTPFAQLIHHESKTRAKDGSIASQRREFYEHAIMKSRWNTHKIEKKHMLRYYSA